jgi:2-phospho-L-lactate guanylyltransferase
MELWAVLPLKDFVSAKQRLSGVLSVEERSGFFQSMVEDLLNVLRQVEAIDGVLVVTDDPAAASLAGQYGCEVIGEGESKGLNGAVRHAVNWLVNRQVATAMMVHGDLPLAKKTDIENLIASHREQIPPSVTLATDSRRQGSNCMLCTPPDVISFHYGVGSFGKHESAAVEAGANWNGQYVASLACDIDEPEDLEALLDSLARDPEYQGRNTWHFLSDNNIPSRIKGSS